jgi:hypothetical protein
MRKLLLVAWIIFLSSGLFCMPGCGNDDDDDNDDNGGAPYNEWVIGSQTYNFPVTITIWSKNDDSLSIGFDKSLINVWPNAFLIIFNVSGCLEGTEYECTATFSPNLDDVYISDNDTTRIIFSRLKLEEGGTQSGSITGNLILDLDSEKIPFTVTFENIWINMIENEH